MGQLEKYGLYVLCLVIFLILGVTIWGGGEVPPGKSPPVSIHAPNNGASPVKANELVSGGSRPRAIEELMDLGGGASPSKGDGGSPKSGGEVAKTEPKNEPKAESKVDTKPATYKVQDGDTFDSIARTKLGKASLRDELMRLNPSVDPKKLRPGMELQLPSAAAIAATDAKTKGALEKPVTPVADGSRSYLVKKGDNFERIAKAELGSAKRTAELLELNSGVDPTKLKPGMSLKLPPK
jgi:LysM repeat protein